VRRLPWVILVIAAIAAGFVIVRGLGRLAQQLPEIKQGSGPIPGAAMRTVRLYFGARDRVGFISEERTIFDPGSMEALAEKVAQEVFQGPVEGLSGLSPDTRVRSFYLTPDGTGYLDLSSDFLARWPRGDGLEWVSLGALVRSLTENIPSISCVQILVEGHVVERAPGSIPLDLPLAPEGFEAPAPEVAP